MQPSLPVAMFVNPRRGARAWNAVCRASRLKPDVVLIGEYGEEKYFRVQGEGRERRCVIIWRDHVSDELVATCGCEAHMIPHAPQPCFHIPSVLMAFEELTEPKKLASMGRNGGRNGRYSSREKEGISADDCGFTTSEVSGPVISEV